MEKLVTLLSEAKPPKASLASGHGQGIDELPNLIAVNRKNEFFLLSEGNILKHGYMGYTETTCVEIKFRKPGDDHNSSSNSMMVDALPEDVQIKRMEFNTEEDCLLLWGSHYVGVVLLPVTHTERSAGQGYQLIGLSAYVVDERESDFVDVIWHPLSPSTLSMLCVGPLELQQQQQGGGGFQNGAENGEKTGFLLLQTLDSKYPEQEVSLGSCMGHPLPVSIAHGGEQGWQRFTTWVLMDNGNVIALCPFLPKDSELRRGDLIDLMEGLKEEWSELNRLNQCNSTAANNTTRHSGNRRGCAAANRPGRFTTPDDLEDQSDDERQTPIKSKVQQRLDTLEDRRRWLLSVFGQRVFHGGNEADDMGADEDDFDMLDDELPPPRAEDVDDGHIFNGEGGYDHTYSHRRSSSSSKASMKRRVRVKRRLFNEWVKVLYPSRLWAHKAQVQDLVSACNESPVGKVAGKPCCLKCVTAAPTLRDSYHPGGIVGMAGSAILARAYVTGQVDCIIVIGGVEPKWIFGEDDDVSIEDYHAPVIECIDVSMCHSSQSDGGGGVDDSVAVRLHSSNGMGPTLVFDPLEKWVMYVVTPFRLVQVHLKWAQQLEEYGNSVEELRGTGVGIDNMEDMLRKVLRCREYSSVVDVLCLLPKNDDAGGGGGGRNTIGGGRWNTLNPHAIIGCAITNSPEVGHLLLARLASGDVEVVNLRILDQQSDALLRRAEPKVGAKGKSGGDGGGGAADTQVTKVVEQLPPFENTTMKLIDSLEQGVKRHAYQLHGSKTHPSNADEGAVQNFIKETERLEEDVAKKIEELHIRTKSRIEMLRDVHAYQQEQLQSLNETVNRLKAQDKRLSNRVKASAEMEENLKKRVGAVLYQSQVWQPSVTRAEKVYASELNRWAEQSARWERDVNKLQRISKPYLEVNENNGGGGGGGGGSSNGNDDKDGESALAKALLSIKLGKEHEEMAFPVQEYETQLLFQMKNDLLSMQKKLQLYEQ